MIVPALTLWAVIGLQVPAIQANLRPQFAQHGAALCVRRFDYQIHYTENIIGRHFVPLKGV